MSRSRYPGAQPFREEQADIFFGRQETTEEFYQLIRQEPLTVLYAKSGQGKSSLLNAGLIPRLRREKTHRPIPIRFLAYTGNEKMPVETTANRIRGNQTNPHSFLNQLIENENTLWRHLKEQQLSADTGEGLLLLFDQFEELFTYPKEAQLQFRRQLAEALYTPLPQRYWDMLDLYDPKDMPFSPEQLARLQQPFDLRIVISIRQDRMHLLGNLADYLPTISKHWYELKALDRESARQAIVLPAMAEGEFSTPPFEYTPDALKEMLDFLSEGEQENIESTQLQIVCNALEQRVKKLDLKTVDRSTLGRLGEIIENYYSEKIATISNPEQQFAARRLIEEGLIFEEEERRLSLYEGQILQAYNIESETLRTLVNSHLLRAEPSLRGGYTYELSHDTLVDPILKAKAERLEVDRKIQEAKIQEQQARALEVEKRKRRRARWIAMGTSLLAILAIAMSAWAFSERNRAEEALSSYRTEEQKRQELELKEMIESIKIYRDAGYLTNARQLLDSIIAKDVNKLMQDQIPELQKSLEQ